MSEVFDDLEAEQEALDGILSVLTHDDWLRPSAAAGWTVADVMLHLAQTEEFVIAAAAATPDADPVGWRRWGDDVDSAMDVLVESERTEPELIYQRWQAARRGAVAALRAADPKAPLRWVTSSLKPRTLATTRLAEHWAHALDVAGGLDLDYPDTARLRHIAWLGHGTLPYAFGLIGEPAHEVRADLTAPDGSTWSFGSEAAGSRISGPAGAFCRVGAQRLAPEESGLATSGPHALSALRVLRNYATT